MVEHFVGINEDELDSLLSHKRFFWRSYHLSKDATLEKWFEFESSPDPFVKVIFGAILGKQDGGIGTEFEIENQIEKMVEKASPMPNFRIIEPYWGID